MVGQRIGYIRISTLDQAAQKQLDGITLNQIFTENSSAKDANRPELQEMIRFVKKGDTIVIDSMDRLAKTLDDLRSFVKIILSKGVSVEFVKEKLLFTIDDLPTANLMMSVMGAFIEFERAVVKECQREDIVLAKNRGAYKGRKRELSAETVAIIKKSIEEGKMKSEVAKAFGISRETLYRYLDEHSLSLR